MFSNRLIKITGRLDKAECRLSNKNITRLAPPYSNDCLGREENASIEQAAENLLLTLINS
jgi:hypothetical protein